MKIVLVRHAQTEDNFNNIMQGLRNNLLNDTGRRDSLKLREKLKGINFDYCYTSPLVRCVETAFILIGDKCEMIKDDRLIERDLGELEGKKRDTYDISKYWDYDLNSNDLGVEPVRSVIDRCRDFLEYVKNKYPSDTNILIVTHSAPVKALKLLLENKELKGNLFERNIKNSEYLVFDI
ncbi:MAG: histidine phosphatase family protein [Bacilli bacterium]|nr:histidine phosphatase family protein [Bacilli bacterium]